METGSKKHILAERYLETGVAEGLTNLFVCNYSAFKVLSLHSDLSRRLLAYKILHQSEDVNDAWLDAPFKEIITVDFNPEFTLVPNQFSHSHIGNSETYGYQVNGNSIEKNHFVYGLSSYNAIRPETNKVYLFKNNSLLNVLIFKDKNCLFSNTFSFNNETEILYFMLASLESSDCTQEDAHVFLDYNLASDETVKNFLKPYFKTVEALRFDNDSLDEEILNLPELLFVNYAMSLCV